MSGPTRATAPPSPGAPRSPTSSAPATTLPAGLVALEARPRSEVILWEPRSRALIVGDALLGDGEKGAGLHTCPASWLPESTDLDDLRAALRPALDLPVELILTSHGAPVLSDADSGARPGGDAIGACTVP